MASRKVDIQISTKADTTGAKTTTDAIDKMVDKVDEAEVAVEDLSQAVDKLDGKLEETSSNSSANPMIDGSQLRVVTEAIEETVVAVDTQTVAVEELAEATGDLEQQEADLAAARKKATERRVEQYVKEEQAEIAAQKAAQDSVKLRIAAGAALAASARQVSALTLDVIRQYKELGVELGTFESIGLEFADFLTSPFDYVTDAFTDYKADLVALKESQLEVIRQEALYQETIAKRDKLLAEASSKRVSNYLAAEKTAIDAQTTAYERQMRVVKSLADLEEARAKSADAMAIASGADPAAVAAAAAARQGAAAGATEDQRILDAEQKLQAAQRSYEAAVSALARGQTGTRDEIEALSTAAQEAQAAVGDAVAEVETVRTEAEAAKAAIASEAVTQQLEVVASAKTSLTEAAETAKATLETEAAEQGRELTEGGKESLKILTEALKDGVVTPEEMGAIRDAIQQVKNSRDAADAEIRKSFGELEKANNAALASQKMITQRLHQQALQLERIQSQIRSGN
jgi:hypothetical protein